MKKKAIKLLCHIAPGAMTNMAYKQVSSPQVKKLREHELEVLDKAERKTISFRGFDIQTYKWGIGSKSILLIHGWEGQAGNFADIIERLLESDYTVHSFDGPSHGFSSTGSTTLFEFAELVGALIKQHNVSKLLSHSFGGVATVYALWLNRDIAIDKYMLLTTPNRFRTRIDDVARSVGISDRVKQRLINRLEKESGLKVDDMNVADFAKEINVKDALIIHDKNDKVVLIEHSRAVYENWSVCKMKEIEGTGHFRILRTSSVIDDVIAFFE